MVLVARVYSGQGELKCFKDLAAKADAPELRAVWEALAARSHAGDLSAAVPRLADALLTAGDGAQRQREQVGCVSCVAAACTAWVV